MPARCSCCISSSIHCASLKSLADSCTRTGSPGPASVRRFLPRRRCVVADQVVGGVQDVAEAAVVALQLDDVLHPELALEVGHVADLGAAEGIDALVVVAHGQHRGLGAGEHLQPGVLQAVRVLELVHQDVAETALVVLAQQRVVAHQLIGAQHQLGKVHHAFALALVFIGLVDLHQRLGLAVVHHHALGPLARLPCCRR